MELVEILSVLRRRKLLVAVVLLAAIAAAMAIKLKMKSVPTGTATVQLLVDSPQSALGDLQQDPTPLAARAAEFAQLMTSGAVLNSIAHTAGISPNDITAAGPYSGTGQALDVATPSEARGVQLVAEKPRYRLTFVAQTDIPIITASVQAPTSGAAAQVAESIYSGLRTWLDSLQGGGNVPLAKRVTIRQLGGAQVGQVNSSSSTMLAGVAAIAVLMVGLLSVIVVSRRRRWDEAPSEAGASSHGDIDWGGEVDLGTDELAIEPLSNERPVSFREYVG
jgi:hypothetical protein